MVNRVIDPTKFVLLASVVDWRINYRYDITRLPPPDQIAGDRGLRSARLVQLRWVTDPALGYPTEPFTVWRRRSEPPKTESSIDYRTIDFLGARLVLWEQPRVFVRAQLTGSSGNAIGFAGAPYASSMVSPQEVTSGQTQYVFSGPAIQCLVLSPEVTLNALSGLDGDTALDLDWEEIEIVGLPVDAGFDGVQDLDRDQGPVSAPQSPPDAALDRFRRGAPFYGWRSTLDTGTPAPPWQPADPKAMLEVVRESLLPRLRAMVDLPAEQQAEFTTEEKLAAPDGNDPTAIISPLRTLIYGAATDPLASLITGFGTAYEDLGDHRAAPYAASSNYDYMVTAHYGNGTNHIGEAVEFAAIVFAPGTAP